MDQSVAYIRRRPPALQCSRFSVTIGCFMLPRGHGETWSHHTLYMRNAADGNKMPKSTTALHVSYLASICYTDHLLILTCQ